MKARNEMASTGTPSQNSQAFSMLSITFIPIIGGAIIGASTNAINGALSPVYYRNILQWHNVEHIWRASIAQGIFEGLLYGILFSVVFTPVVIIVSRGQCSFAFACRHLLIAIAAVYCCWALGGLVAIGLATLSPEFYRNTFIRVPNGFREMLCYAWVGGSIWGALLGGLLAAVIGSALFAIRWRILQAETSD